MQTSPQTLQLLEGFLKHPFDWCHGYELSRDTGLRHGTIYPQLMRLEAMGVLEAHWEQVPNSRRRPRHMYRLTEHGRHFAATTVHSATV